jgi:hypothetical protein
LALDAKVERAPWCSFVRNGAVNGDVSALENDALDIVAQEGALGV